jgi:hypothetical protein
VTAEIHTKEPGGQDAVKTKTVLLLDHKKEFLSFGSKALDAYYNDNHNATDLLFEKFKMNLNTEGNDRTIKRHAWALNGKLHLGKKSSEMR